MPLSIAAEAGGSRETVSSPSDVVCRRRVGLAPGFGDYLYSIQIAIPAAISSITGSGSCPTTGLTTLTLDRLIWMRDMDNPFREYIRAKSARVSGNRSCSDSDRGSTARYHRSRRARPSVRPRGARRPERPGPRARRGADRPHDGRGGRLANPPVQGARLSTAAHPP